MYKSGPSPVPQDPPQLIIPLHTQTLENLKKLIQSLPHGIRCGILGFSFLVFYSFGASWAIHLPLLVGRFAIGMAGIHIYAYV
jgi:hypothetical protein